ncbi:carbonic anhydrase [Desulfocucumis palustris]|uniref:carbonic anhydrase n=1 Tax=Desulfocucumis palustris TaxID=1898651 RepID=A0A2L2XG57_9FIRM|nr:carbonic anhydrase [Desulfocucumis palustris]GBF34703.1 carbonic anhydrase [Desulfocucumis palustris]
MSLLEEILNHNRKFVEQKEYEKFQTTKFPDKKMVILTCMDTRLTELLPKAMNLKNGDAKIIKNAGELVSHPMGSIMRSILVAIYELGAEEVYVVGHSDCGMAHINPEKTLKRIVDRGISKQIISALEYAGFNLNNWLQGFNNIYESVQNSVDVIKNHPLMPGGILVHGLVINPGTGGLEVVVDGSMA